MKKIIIAIDGTNFSNGAFKFVRKLNEKAPVLVAGIFVPQVDYANLWSYSTAAASGPLFVPLVEEEESKEVAKNIEKFQALCKKNNIACRVHKDFFDFVLPELKRESRFADVMVLSGELFYQHIIGAGQFDYMRNVLHNAECPVLIVPEHLEFPDTNIIAYDGSDEAVYAMKQFAYIFPEFASNKTVLVYAEKESEKDFPSRALISELATQHFTDLVFHKAELDPKKDFSEWVNEKKGAILVTGSFSRSAFSEAFRKSFVADIIREHKVPVFIAHK